MFIHFDFNFRLEPRGQRRNRSTSQLSLRHEKKKKKTSTTSFFFQLIFINNHPWHGRSFDKTLVIPKRNTFARQVGSVFVSRLPVKRVPSTKPFTASEKRKKKEKKRKKNHWTTSSLRFTSPTIVRITLNTFVREITGSHFREPPHDARSCVSRA